MLKPVHVEDVKRVEELLEEGGGSIHLLLDEAYVIHNEVAEHLADGAEGETHLLLANAQRLGFGMDAGERLLVLLEDAVLDDVDVLLVEVTYKTTRLLVVGFDALMVTGENQPAVAQPLPLEQALAVDWQSVKAAVSFQNRKVLLEVAKHMLLFLAKDLGKLA